MKKQVARKLVLHKETLGRLTEKDLSRIAAGIGPSDLPEDSCYNTCWCDT